MGAQRALFLYGGVHLEVKINREIRDYTESMFFGLSLRQFVFSILAVIVAVGIYFGLRGFLGTETVSWMCILGAAPFAALGFIKYHGMTAERFAWAYLKSEFLVPRKLGFCATNVYYEALKPIIAIHQKKEYLRHD
jgi:riboflavin transporter FmnP